jgi:lysophospholipid acyltransferase (LPLAT)-like uncharacterized protein
MRKVYWRIVEWPLALTMFALAMLIRSTSRVTIEGDDPLGAAVFVNWHRFQSFLIPFHGSRRRWMLVSPAPQLTVIARLCRLCGLRLVRGASGERGKEAREELKNLLRRGESIALAVDGPHGPPFKAKPGCADLARATGVPIVPVAYRAKPAHEFRWRWDHTLMPLPFSRVTIVYGHPIVASGTDEEILRDVEDALNELASPR